MGKFSADGFAPQQRSETGVGNVKQQFVKGVDGGKMTKGGRWSRWIAEAIFYPQTKKLNQNGRVGFIVVKFRPYVSSDGTVHTYSPAIMLNKSEDFFWKFMNGYGTGSVGKFYWQEKKTRDNTIARRVGADILNKQANLNEHKGAGVLSYNKREDKFHVLQNHQVMYLPKNAQAPLRTHRLKRK